MRTCIPSSPPRLPRGLSLLLLLAAAPLSAQRAGAAGSPQVHIDLEHATRTVTLQVGDGPSQTFRTGEAVRVPAGLPATVSLTRTNSALYTCTVSQQPLAVPELDTLQVFLKGIRGYLPLIARPLAALAGPGPVELTTLDEAAASLEEGLQALDSLVDGSAGLQRARRQVVTSLSLMRLSPHAVDPEVPAALRAWFRQNRLCTAEDCQYLTYPAALLTAFDTVQVRVQRVNAALAEATPLEQQAGEADRPRFQEAFKAAEAGLTAAEKALESSQAVLRDAYALERLAVRTMNASSTVPCDIVEVSWDEGRALVFNIAPIAGDELEPIARRQAFEHKLDVLPRWKIRPSVGVSFLMAPGAEYPEYAAAETADGLRIAEKGAQDARFTYGLTLGLTYGPLDRRHDQGWAVWLPELIVNPLDEVRAVGIGGGVSYGIVKLGAGRLFTRHKVLDRQQVDDPLSSADALRTRETFGSGEWYIGISLLGLPPFIPES